MEGLVESEDDDSSMESEPAEDKKFEIDVRTIRWLAETCDGDARIGNEVERREIWFG